jgi:DNA-binding response OmpR family regulator
MGTGEVPAHVVADDVSLEQSPPHTGVVAVFPDPPPVELARLLDLDGYRWKAIAADDTGGFESALDERTQWDAVVTVLGDDTDSAEDIWDFCGLVRTAETPVLLLVGGRHLHLLSGRHDYFDDFVIAPFHPQELRARLTLLLSRAGKVNRSELVTYGPLALNVETYQAVLDGRHLDLTYMEYELLRFLASSPGQVFTREILLNQVWGYEYYGGARTVDVHIRRLRAKMGEDHSLLISTVRGVGYKLGQSRWRG